VGEQDTDHALVELIEKRHHVRGREVLGQRREAADVGDGRRRILVPSSLTSS
jgi:hypothetical protein